MAAGSRIVLEREDDWWIATDEETGVTSQGRTRNGALENLDDAVAVHRGKSGRPPTDEELREAGIDPSDNVTGEDGPPGVLR